MSAGIGDEQSCSVRQCPKELPNGDVEAEWGLLQHAVVCAKLIFVLHPTEAVDDGGMLVQRAFGLAGGPGGVNEVGRVLRSELSCAFLVARIRRMPPCQGT